MTARHDELVVGGARTVRLEVDGIRVDRAEVVVARGRGTWKQIGTVVSASSTISPNESQSRTRCAGGRDLLHERTEHEVRHDRRVACRWRSAADRAGPPRRQAAARCSIDVSRKLPFGNWTSSWWLVGTPTVWMRSTGVPSSAEVLVAVGRIGSETGAERLEPRQRSVGEALEVARDAIRRRRACTRRVLRPSPGSSRTGRRSASALLARRYQPGGASPSPEVVMGGKSGGTHRIQYSSGAPPPVGVMRTTIASSAGIVSVVSTHLRTAHRPDGDGGARHAAHVHGQLVGRQALAVGDVVVLRRRELRERRRTAHRQLRVRAHRRPNTAEHVDDDVGALGRGDTDRAVVGERARRRGS